MAKKEKEQQEAESPQQQPQRVFEITKREKVAIVGCADSKGQAPFDKPQEWELWGVNNLHLTIPKAPWSRWFELHSFSIDPSSGKYLRRGKPDFRGQAVDQYLMGLQALNIPVYMQRGWPIIPNAVPFPVQQCLKQFGNYFTNTISWEIALAILEGFKTIGIYGVDMSVSSPLRHQDEYSHQRPSCEYFIGLARGMGIEVILPDTCDLLKTNFLYCFQEPEEDIFIMKIEEMMKSMEQRRQKCIVDQKNADAKNNQYIGAVSALSEVRKIRLNY